jgi:uncharacterized protein YoxC
MKLKYIAIATGILAVGSIVYIIIESKRIKKIDEKIHTLEEALDKLDKV